VKTNTIKLHADGNIKIRCTNFSPNSLHVANPLQGAVLQELGVAQVFQELPDYLNQLIILYFIILLHCIVQWVLQNPSDI
jgi:hypothetical protein